MRTATWAADRLAFHLDCSRMTNRSPRKPRRRCWQFSLRTLFVVVLLFAVPCSWFAVKMQQARTQREVVRTLREGGADAFYDFESVESRSSIPKAEPPAPAWLLELLGVDFFCDVVAVYGYGHDFTDQDAAHLEGLTGLEVLCLPGTQVTDAGVEHLKGLTTLIVLDLTGTQVTDAGVDHLNELTNVEWLFLGGTQLTDVGLSQLQGLSKLGLLVLNDTQVTEEGVRKLQRTLPNCKVDLTDDR